MSPPVIISRHLLRLLRKALFRPIGFSLIEMLMVIGVVGIMVAIAIPVLSGGVRQSAKNSVNRRNAQALASLSMAATAAGADVVVNGDVRATIERFSDGVRVTAGNYPTVYQMTLPTDEAKDGAAAYLEATGGALLYRPNGQ